MIKSRTLFFGDRTRGLAHLGHQFARVFGRDAQSGVDQWTVAGVGDVTFTTFALGKIDGLQRAGAHADAAPFAGQRVNHVFGLASLIADGQDRSVTTKVQAASTAETILIANGGLVAGDEGIAPEDRGIQDQVQVRRIHVAIGQHLALGQRGECRHDAGLARPALAADDDQFFHDAASRPS